MDIFAWRPLEWVARGVLLGLLIGGGWVGLLYFVRYLRPKNVIKLWDRDVAEIEEIGAFGATLRLTADRALHAEEALETQSEKIETLEEIAFELNERLTDVENAHQQLSRVVNETEKESGSDSQNGESP